LMDVESISNRIPTIVKTSLPYAAKIEYSISRFFLAIHGVLEFE
jgi:hypothetical protein